MSTETENKTQTEPENITEPQNTEADDGILGYKETESPEAPTSSPKLSKKAVYIIIASCVAFVILAILAVIIFLPKGTTHMPDMTSDEISEETSAEDTLNVKMEKESDKEEEGEIESVSETETEKETAPETEEIKVDGLSLSETDITLTVGERLMPLVTMTPADATDKSEKWSSNNTGVATVNQYGDIKAVGAGTCTVTVVSVNNPDVYGNINVTVNPAPEPVTEATETEAQTFVEEPTYINGILIANKTYALPYNYNPGVDSTAYAALQTMFQAASNEGISLWVASGFRSYYTQKTIYNNYCRNDGVEAADRYSARPGHSEHQTGLAFDLNLVDQSFANTAAGQWLAANCYKYGFIIRYPEGKEAQTGYMYEPWHVRYIGVDNATSVYFSGLCLEEYLGITSVYR